MSDKPEKSRRVTLDQSILDTPPNPEAYLELHDRFRGYVLPMKGKAPDGQMSMRQRGTAAWKNGRDSFYQRPPTRDEVSEWAAEGCGIGVVTGPRSGVVALEIDCPELVMPLLADLPKFKTPIATSPSGGYHLLFRHGASVKNCSIRCPVFNDKGSPWYTGKRELASMRASDLLIVLPPGPGREWLPGRSITEVELADIPPELLDLLARFSVGGRLPRCPDHTINGVPLHHKRLTPTPKTVDPYTNTAGNRSKGVDNPECAQVHEGKTLPIEQITGSTSPIEPRGQDPCPIGKTVLLEDGGRYVLLEASPLIPALVNRLGGRGLRVPCPYHPPDDKASACFWYNESGWYLADHHFSPTRNLPVSQLCADLLTGFLERCRNGSEDRYQHRVYTLGKDGRYKVKLQAFVWLELAAADLGVITLPPSMFPPKLEGFTPDGERVMRFIDQWDRGRRHTCTDDVFPLTRPFLISVVFALPPPTRPGPGEEDEPKTKEWLDAYDVVDNALYRGRTLGILERVEKGSGSKPALYRVVPPDERNRDKQ